MSLVLATMFLEIIISVSCLYEKGLNQYFKFGLMLFQAYKNFETRVNKMKKGVDKVKSKFSPLPEMKQNDNSGEDMEVSDDDKNNER